MSNYTRFDLEQQIFNCWNVLEDIDTLTEAVLDGPKPLTEDEISNVLIGMRQLYDFKFQKLQAIFENLVHERVVSDEGKDFQIPQEFFQDQEDLHSDR